MRTPLERGAFWQEEDSLMTFQVALVGSDGLLVGSDRKCAYRSQEPERGAFLQFEEGAKYVESEGLVCFFAGGPQAQSIADAVVRRGALHELSVPAWRADLQKTGEMIRANSIGDEVIVVRFSTSNADAALINKKEDAVSVSAIPQHLCTGVNVYARFLTEEFWSNRSVDSLRKLALIAMGYAAKERPTEVGCGFDLMVLKDGKVGWESYTEDDSRIRSACYDFNLHARIALEL
jgi:hypothetical protein